MAPKQLPPAKINPTKLLGGSSLATTVKKISAKSIAGGDRSFGLGVIKKQVIKISDLVKTNTLLKAKEEDRKRKLAEQKRFGEKEEKLEKPKEKQDKIPSLPALPKLGFLDRIKSFLFNIFLGYISLRLLPYLPKLAGIVGTIIKVQDTVIDISGKILNGLVSFVDKAYEVHDKTRKFLGDLGGDNFTKTFDGFIDAMDKVILASIAGAIAFGELRDIGGPDSGRPGRGGRPKVTQGRGGQAQRPRIPGTGPRVTSGQGGKLPSRSAISKGGLLGLVNLIPDILNSWDLWQNQGRGKDALRTFFSAVAGAAAGLGAVTAVEAGAAALGITGVGIPAAIALAVSGFAASSLAGTGAYNLADAILKRIGLVDNDPKTGKPYAYRSGGSVTRGGQLTGPIKRTVQKPKVTRTIKVQTTEVKPGQSVGGEDKIKKIFPENETKGADIVNPLGYMKSSYKLGSSTPGFGGIAAIFMKAQLGEKPSNVDYQNAADGLSAWMQRTFGGGIQRTGGAFAGGGEVDAGMFGNGDDMKNVIAKALQNSVAPKVDDIINDLKKQLGLKPQEVKKEEKVNEPSSGEELGNATEIVGGARLLMSAGFPSLAAAVLSSVIQAESAWKGQRTPWVLNDGAGTNKGLISWNRTRITNAEKFLGKPLETASNAEQVKWIKEELKQYGLLDEMTNPQATEEQLKEAVYKYVRWNRRYDAEHWANISKIRVALERGEQGSYIAASPSTLGTGSGSLGAAKSLAENMGLQLTSYVRPGDPGYHGKGRAMDFQTVGAPGNTGTPSQLAYAQKMVSQYGTSLKQLIYTPLGFGIANGKRVGLDYWGDKTNSEHYHHVHVAFNKGGKVKGKRGIDQVRAMLTHGEFVLDLDSTTALEKNFPGFLDALNKANYDGAIKVLRSYAEYEQGSTIHAVVDEKLIPVPIPISSPQQPVVISSGFGESEDSMSFNYTR